MANRGLADLITESALEELAGDRYFERGLAYFRHGAGCRADFTPWLNVLRARHKAKRNFMKRLDRVAAAQPSAAGIRK